MNELIHLTGLTNLPLSSNQKRLWIICQQDKSNPSYNLQFTYQLKGELNLPLFQESIRILINRQHTLFSVFKQNNGSPYCEIVLKPVNVKIFDFSQSNIESGKEQVYSIIGKDVRTPFELETGPLFRFYLFKLDPSNHIFHITVHHIIFDGLSMRLFVLELNRIYNNLLRNKNEIPEPIKFYSYDFAYREEKSGFIENEDQLIKFWKENLKDCPHELRFPYDHSRKSRPSGLGGKIGMKIPLDDSLKLKELSANAGSTLFNTMLSILGLLLQKYTGDNDVCLGIPVSSRRDHPDLEKIFGLFVSTTVVRLKNEGNETVIQYISNTRNVIRDAIKYSKLPFEKIVETINPERFSNINPLFQVALSWITQLTLPMELGDAKGTKISVNEGISQFDFTFYLWESGECIEGEIVYNIDILDCSTIIRLRDNFLSLISNIVKAPETSIDSLTIISEEDTKEILEFTKTSTNYPREKTIIELFEEQVALFPHNKALIFKGLSLTYSQLNERSNQLARKLRSLDIVSNTPVSILAEKSLDVIVGTLGILKAGGCYIPIDPDYPEQRINLIIKNSGSKILLTQSKYMELQLEGIKKINLNSPDSYHSDISNVEKINHSSDLAYIMYTSGTTGIPKGSMILQYSIVRLVRNTNYIDIKSEDRILMANTIVFDAATFEIWGALLNGGSLYIVEKETILNPGTLGEELFKNEITILLVTSSLFTHLAERRPDIFMKLKYLLVGGDVLSAPHVNKVRKVIPGLKIINGYGPTENTTFSTTYLVENNFDHNIPIGKPISNSTTYIFDKNMNYQPIGVIGELYVGGDGVSTGYVNRDDLNKKSFMDHPHIPGERLYKTGDYARWLPDGNIEFHGRIDNQLKIRGFRVELEEIESVLSEIDGVIETVIIPVMVKEGDYRLMAFLNVPETFKMDTKEIIRRIKAKLPSYMVPSAYKSIHGFPKTINGKVDKKALISDIKDLGKIENPESVKWTQTERAIYNIWCDALKTKEISPKDNFFELGGNSLLAISVFSNIESFFNINLGLRSFFDSPRIKDLAESIDTFKLRTLESEQDKRKYGETLKIIEGEI